MRVVKEAQKKLGEVEISKIEFDLTSRDEMPKLLIGLQYIYCTPEIREKVFKILEDMVPDEVDTKNGRPGMELWKILVLGTVRLNCNWDYDKLQDIAKNHNTLRQMLGLGMMDTDKTYGLQTLRDNLSMFTPEILNRINQVVVKSGHALYNKINNVTAENKKEVIKIKGKCDSFVVKTDVHYPTDINKLFDAMRKVITLLMVLCFEVGLSDWRQGKNNLKKIKKIFRKVQNLKRSTSKKAEKKAKREELINDAHRCYIDFCQLYLDKAEKTIKKLADINISIGIKTMMIDNYIKHARREIDQINRRVINGETIPHSEKVFSIFEEHTEWICKGKAGVSQELGLKVCVVEDQYRFILHHQVMENETDDKVAVKIINETMEKFPDFSSCSFDKGFYTPDNRKVLMDLLESVVLPKKGKLSLKDKRIENSDDFILDRRKHSGVESAINALNNHGLDRCLDHGIDGFKRYIALGVLARNIQNLGNIIQKKKVKSLLRSKKIKKTKEISKHPLVA